MLLSLTVDNTQPFTISMCLNQGRGRAGVKRGWGGHCYCQVGAGASGVEVNADHSEARRDAARSVWHVKGGGWKKREQGSKGGTEDGAGQKGIRES